MLTASLRIKSSSDAWLSNVVVSFCYKWHSVPLLHFTLLRLAVDGGYLGWIAEQSLQLRGFSLAKFIDFTQAKYLVSSITAWTYSICSCLIKEEKTKLMESVRERIFWDI